MRYQYGTQQMSFGFSLTPWVKRLMIANGVIFLFTLLLGVDVVADWFGFHPSRILTRPWGALTYMFVHAGFWHVFLNMLMLFFFGPPLERQWGSREFLKFYLVCGLGGAALSFLFMPSSVVGASAAVYGVMAAFAMTWPDSPIYVWGIFPVKAKWLVAFLFVLSFFSAVGGAGGGVAHFAHLGGLITGFIYLKADWHPSERLEKLKKATRVRRFAIVPREESPEEDRTEAGGWKSEDEELLDEVDRILDKISEEGMASLTREELRTLDEVSRKRRSN
ncbi:MAG: rhomboid family intramembrane serine protease [Longimicrobiales bacterium]|nr:rhomboid family intramembrane serine protease [Longimicrobiales bacterium]